MPSLRHTLWNTGLSDAVPREVPRRSLTFDHNRLLSVDARPLRKMQGISKLPLLTQYGGEREWGVTSCGRCLA